MSNATDFIFPEFETLGFLDRFSFRFVRLLYSTGVSPQLVAPAVTIGLALLIVVIGACSTLAKPREALDSNIDRENPDWDPTDNDGSAYIKSSKLELELLNLEALSLLHALLLPVLSGVTLYTLDYCLKNIAKEKLLYFLNVYMLVTCPFSHASVFDYLLTATTRRVTHLMGRNSSLLFKRHRLIMASDAETLPLGVVEHLDASSFKKDDAWFQKFKIHLRKQGVKIIRPKTVKKVNQPLSFVFDTKYLFSLPLALGSAYLFYSFNPVLNSSYTLPTNNWLVTNMMGINFAIFGIKHVKISNFSIAFCLLVGLFFYDIYFVFGNKIMIKVATGIDIPIKLCIPLHPTGELYHDIRWSILGLGDIVLPGCVISLCLRYDLSNFHKTSPRAFHHLSNFSSPYFLTAMISYTIGLVASYSALIYFKSGQPALLYIVPSMIFGTIILALLRGELKQLFHYSEHIEEFDVKKIDEDESMVLITTDEDTSEDDNYLYEHPNDSYDEWEAKVELKRLGTEDLHSLLEELIDEDDDDDTFLINSDPESGDELEEVEIVEEVNEIELFRLQNDLKQEPREWYSDEEDNYGNDEADENYGDDDNDDDDDEDEEDEEFDENVYILR